MAASLGMNAGSTASAATYGIQGVFTSGQVPDDEIP